MVGGCALWLGGGGRRRGRPEVRPLSYLSGVVIDTGAPASSTSQSSGFSLPTLPDPVDEASSGQVVSAAASAARISYSQADIGSAVSSDGTQLALSATEPTPSQAVLAVTAATKAFIALRVSDLLAEASSLSPQLATLGHQLQALDAKSAALGGSVGPTAGTAAPSPLSTEIAVVSDQYAALYGQQVQLQIDAQLVRRAQTGPPAVATVGTDKKELVAIRFGRGPGSGLRGRPAARPRP